MAWLFVPGLAGSNSGSTSPNPDTELWVSLSGKHEQCKALVPVVRTDSRPSGSAVLARNEVPV